MAEARSSPYRKKSLERLSSPERLDQLLQLVDRRSWLPLATLGVLLLLLVAWAIFGRVPERVHGRGILVRPREVVEIDAPGSGYLVGLDVRPDMKVERGQLLGTIARPDLEKQIELERARLEQLTAFSGASEILEGQDARIEDEGGLDAYVRRNRTLARKAYDEQLELLGQEQRRLEDQKAVAEQLAERLRQQLERRRQLKTEEIVSEDALIVAERDYVDSIDRVSEIDGDLRELQSRRLRIEEEYQDRLQDIANLTLLMQDYAQQVAEVNREIERLETALDKESRIVAEQAGIILEVRATVGSYLSPGDPIAAMTLSGDNSPLESVVYFNVRDGKRLKPHMRIQITPDTVERERYGGIVGAIEWISSFAVSLAEAEAMVGNRQIAERLTEGGYLIQVRAALQRDPTTPSGFAWTSSQGPAGGFSPGTTTTARVTVEERAPITFVLPSLRAASGID